MNCVNNSYLEVELLTMFKQLTYSTLSLLLVIGVSFSAFGHGDNPTLLEDVNKDGIVNIQDLVLVAAAFGTTRGPHCRTES